MSDRAIGYGLLVVGCLGLWFGIVLSVLDGLLGACFGALGIVGIGVGIRTIVRENANDDGEGRS